MLTKALQKKKENIIMWSLDATRTNCLDYYQVSFSFIHTMATLKSSSTVRLFNTVTKSFGTGA